MLIYIHRWILIIPLCSHLNHSLHSPMPPILRNLWCCPHQNSPHHQKNPSHPLLQNSSKGKRKQSAITDGEFEQWTSKSRCSSHIMSSNHLMANEPGAAALLNGINRTFTNLSQMVQASTHSTPQGYVKDAIRKLNSTWGDTDGFSAVKKSVLLQLFSSDFKKATTYSTNVDPEACCLWVDLELLDLQDKINAAETLFARWCQGQSSEPSLVLLHQLKFYLSLLSKLVDLVVLLCTISVFTYANPCTVMTYEQKEKLTACTHVQY